MVVVVVVVVVGEGERTRLAVGEASVDKPGRCRPAGALMRGAGAGTCVRAGSGLKPRCHGFPTDSRRVWTRTAWRSGPSTCGTGAMDRSSCNPCCSLREFESEAEWEERETRLTFGAEVRLGVDERPSIA